MIAAFMEEELDASSAVSVWEERDGTVWIGYPDAPGCERGIAAIRRAAVTY